MLAQHAPATGEPTLALKLYFPLRTHSTILGKLPNANASDLKPEIQMTMVFFDRVGRLTVTWDSVKVARMVQSVHTLVYRTAKQQVAQATRSTHRILHSKTS